MNVATHDHDAGRVIVCSHVVDNGLPVLQVTHELDGDWQFLCGGNDHVSKERVRFACWTCLVDEDSTLGAVADLWPGYTVTRASVGPSWFAAPITEASQ